MDWLIKALTNPVVVPVLTATGTWLAHKILGDRLWKKITARAMDIVRDPANPTSDPTKAVEIAVIESMQPRIKRATNSAALFLNGGKH